MAIDYSEFIYTNKDKEAKGLNNGIKANQNFTRFFLRFKINDKPQRKIFDYSKENWNKKDRIKKANLDSETYKEEKRIALENPFNQESKLNFIADEYFNKKCTNSDWTKSRKRLYELYIEPLIGSKKASSIIENDIDTVRKFMETNGFSKQNANGSSIRSIEKVLLQVLKPVLEYASSNGALKRKVPPINIPNRNKKKKKIVTGASSKISTLYNAIQARYKNEPFYRALFMFALFGRRWNEIASLKWADIDLLTNSYTVQAENNKIGEAQTYDLPQPIKEPLMEIQDKNGLVFKSPVTGKKLTPPRKQLAKIKADTGIEELTMHYFRHILVTALGETGTSATVLSASLGHIRADTVDKHYRSINHLKGSQDANKQLENIIDVEVKE